MSAPLFLFLRLLHIESALGFRFPFLPANLPAFRFHFLPLSLKRLLGLRAYTGVLQMLSGIPASSFGIVSHLSDFCFDGRAERQFIVVVQDEIQDIIIFRLRPEGHFTDRQLSILYTFKDANPERILEEHGQTCFHFSRLHAAVHDGSVLILGDHGRSDLRQQRSLDFTLFGVLPSGLFN